MATIGNELKNPESGWKRYDDSDPVFKYFNISKNNYGSPYKGNYTTLNSDNSKCTFLFKGTKLRVISLIYQGWSSKVGISIDGIEETFSENGQHKNQALVYEKLELLDTIHYVEIYRINPYAYNEQIGIDAIDIDENGRILHPDEVINISDLAVGKRIRCNYKNYLTKNLGSFSNLGQETTGFLPVSPSGVLDGDFYFIMVDILSGKKTLVADRNIQNNISWDELEKRGVIKGSLNPYFEGTIVAQPNIKNVYSSGGYSSLTADKLFDGSTATYWNSMINDSKGNTYVTIELHTPSFLYSFNIRGIRLISGSNYGLRDYKIYGSNDNNKFEELYSGSHQNNTSDETVTLNCQKKYLYYKFESLNSWYESKRVIISSIEYIVGSSAPSYEFEIRLLTGGSEQSDKHNEWDRYIVDSTLNDTIVAGDNMIWNWNLNNVRSWTSTTALIDSLNKVVRGNSINGISPTGIDAWTFYPSNTANSSIAFRPALDIKNLYQFYINDGGVYKTFKNDQWRNITDPFNPDVAMQEFSILNRKDKLIELSSTLDSETNNGKIYKATIDLDNIYELKSIKRE